MAIGDEQEDVSGTMTLDDLVGEVYGDAPIADDTEDPSRTSEPAEPAAPSVPGTEIPAAPEEETPVEPTAEPAAAAPETPSDDPAPTTEPVDLLKDATPLTYQVDGETRTYEGIKVVPGVGAVIDDPKVLDDIAKRLGERDHYFGANQTLYQTSQRFEQLGGEARFVELTEKHAKMDAVLALMLPMLNDPLEMAKCLEYTADGQSVQFNKDRMDLLIERIKNGANEAAFTAKSALATHLSTTGKEATDTQAFTQKLAQAPDYAWAKVIEAYPALNNATDKAAYQAFVKSFGAHTFRKASAEEAAQAKVPVGDLIIDYPALDAWANPLALARANEKTVAATTEKATKENGAKLAAAARPAPKAAPAKPAARPAAPNSRAADADAAWDLMEGLASVR